MAEIVLEVNERAGVRYHPITKPVVRVGRALDNDIIIADPTVAPHHFIIKKDDQGQYGLFPISDDNRIHIGKQPLIDPLSLAELPVAFNAGRTAVRILSIHHPVAPTRPLSCQNGGHCLFGSWPWALAMFGLFLSLSAVDNFLSTPEQITWQSFGRDQALILITALGIVSGLVLINRFTSHRWEYPASLSYISLLLIAATLLDQASAAANYHFTSATPGFLINLGWHLVIVPLTLAWFLIRFNHGNTATSLVVIATLLTPAAYLQSKETAIYFGWFDSFSKTAHYSDDLMPWDWREQHTLTINEFHNVIQELAPQRETPQE